MSVEADTDRAIEAANDLIDQGAVTTAPVPVERLARAQGVQVRYAPLDGELSGMAHIKDGIAVIGVNSLHHRNRQRFTLAHELGHIQLHRQRLEEEVHLDRGSLRRDWLATQGIDAHEIEANVFASELLMPKRILDAIIGGRLIDLEDDDVVDVLARRFRVSSAAMRYRLQRAR
jgi:Zn-dependent peptidase ImmA (M78 family)